MNIHPDLRRVLAEEDIEERHRRVRELADRGSGATAKESTIASRRLSDRLIRRRWMRQAANG